MNEEIYKLAVQIIKAGKENGITIATAESCTGGGIGAALTAISGSSDVFAGGIIAYANEAKIKLLGVSAPIILKHGAVSEQAAKAMANGARQALDTDLAVSVTGIAGPTGGTKDKPVGTVWIGLAGKGKSTKARHFLFADKSRESIRTATIIAALTMLNEILSK